MSHGIDLRSSNFTDSSEIGSSCKMRFHHYSYLLLTKILLAILLLYCFEDERRIPFEIKSDSETLPKKIISGAGLAQW